MFCLPYPQSSEGVIEPIEIPYVANFDYDISIPGNFYNFVRKCRFNSYDRNPDELASLMQSWLFFGLISEVVGRQVDHDFVVRSRYNGEDEVRFIDSRLDGALADIVTERFRSLRQKGQDHRTLIWSTIEKMIKVADARALEFEKVITS
jgi:hypothetical protein